MDVNYTRIVIILQAICSAILCLESKERYTSHPCVRPCAVNRPMDCYYNFTLELYNTMSKACYNCPFNKTDCFRPHCIPADGVSRGVLVVNRMLPGPSIHVCEGDTVIVNVRNELTGGEGTSIHWHGILQHGSQYMDGVSMVTQCPIPIKTSFEYRFKVNYTGTHFWHAHTAMHRADGIFGAFVVRQADELEPHFGLYEHDLPEHTILVNDWLGVMSESKFARHHHAGGDNTPKSILINGKGSLQPFYTDNDNTSTYTPNEVFKVKRGYRYRFRIISNGILNCPKRISIDNHTLTVIASDGNPFKKIEVDFFNIFAGERYDIVLNTSMDIQNYKIRVKGLADCEPLHAKQVAILHYEGAPEVDDTVTTWSDTRLVGKILNPWNKKGDASHIQVTELKSLVNSKEALKDIPDKQFFLAMDFNEINNYHYHEESLYPMSSVDDAMRLYSPQVNHVSLSLPPSPPLTQLSDLDESIFCNYETIETTKNCSEVYCECVYRLQVDLNDVVELVMIDEGKTYNANHPMHLHGHVFHVVAMDKLGENTTLDEVKQLDKTGKILRNLNDSVAKDTVTVPDGGYSVLRFHATNPGFWFFHCHIEFHVEIGMGLIIQVGGKDDLPNIPRNFPKCGDWKFSGFEDAVSVGACGQQASIVSMAPAVAFQFMFPTAISFVVLYCMRL